MLIIIINIMILWNGDIVIDDYYFIKNSWCYSVIYKGSSLEKVIIKLINMLIIKLYKFIKEKRKNRKK